MATTSRERLTLFCGPMKQATEDQEAIERLVGDALAGRPLQFHDKGAYWVFPVQSTVLKRENAEPREERVGAFLV